MLLPTDVVNTFNDCNAANNRDRPVNYDRRYLAARGRYDWQRSWGQHGAAHSLLRRHLEAEGDEEGISINISISVAADTSVNDASGKEDGSGIAVISVQKAACAAIASSLSSLFSSPSATANMSDFTFFLGAASQQNITPSSLSFVFENPVIILPSPRFIVPADDITVSMWANGGIIFGVLLSGLVALSMIIIVVVGLCYGARSCKFTHSLRTRGRKEVNEVVVIRTVSPGGSGGGDGTSSVNPAERSKSPLCGIIDIPVTFIPPTLIGSAAQPSSPSRRPAFKVI